MLTVVRSPPPPPSQEANSEPVHTVLYIAERKKQKTEWSVILLFSTVSCTLFCECQVKVAFRCSMSLLDHVDQADEEVYPGVTLIECARGGRKLRFQQYLLIHYSNNSLQVRHCSESQL